MNQRNERPVYFNNSSVADFSFDNRVVKTNLLQAHIWPWTGRKINVSVVNTNSFWWQVALLSTFFQQRSVSLYIY